MLSHNFHCFFPNRTVKTLVYHVTFNIHMKHLWGPWLYMANLYIRNSPISLQFLNEIAWNFVRRYTRLTVITLCKFYDYQNTFVYFHFTSKSFRDDTKRMHVFCPSITCPKMFTIARKEWKIAFWNFEVWNLTVKMAIIKLTQRYYNYIEGWHFVLVS